MPLAVEPPRVARGLSSLEILPVGNSVALFQPDNHAVALLNASAAALCRALLANPDILDADLGGSPTVTELLAGLREAGFLAPPSPPADTAPSLSSPAIVADDVPALGIYALGKGPRVRLAVGEPTLAPLLEAALRPLAAEADGECSATLSVAPAANGLCVSRDHIVVGRDLDVADARRTTLQAMLMALHPAATIAAILHASTIRLGNRAVLLAGATGSGKSTLAMALAADGAGWLADDFTGLDRTGRSVRTFPVAASIKHGSWPLLVDRFPALVTCAVHEVGDRRVRYFDPRLSEPATAFPEQSEIAAIVFPSFTPGAPAEPERLSPEATLTRLLATGSEVVDWPRSLAPMAACVNDIPAWSLAFGDLAAAAAAVRALVAPRLGARIAS